MNTTEREMLIVPPTVIAQITNYNVYDHNTGMYRSTKHRHKQMFRFVIQHGQMLY